MIQLFASGLAMAALVCGAVLAGVWLKRQIGRLHRRAHPQRTLEVLARVGLHQNQGLAVVRVGRRHLLVSSGEGGARTLAELSEEDLRPEVPVETPAPTPIRFPSLGARAWRRTGTALALACVLLGAPAVLAAQDVVGPGAPQGPSFAPVFDALPPISLQVGTDEQGLRLNGPVGTVVVLGLLALTPTLILLTTSFTRILVVLHLLRQALGTQTTPPSHLLAGLALLLSAVVMGPTLDQVRATAVDPWLAGELDDGAMLRAASIPMREFMLYHARESDLATFMRASGAPAPTTTADISNVVLTSAFVTSELRTAFEIGFAIFLPFIVIDLVVAAVLTSMGMFMLPPTMIALPCKLMLFVLMDGWALVLGTLAESFV
ncbi:MAG: flagellar type III secretion system pore protein FliP [Longimicrobiales bacterium]